MKVEWRSGIGYGDFVTGLAYAANCVLKYQTDVDISIHWNHSKDYKPNQLDPETVIERCEYIHKLINCKALSLHHIFDSYPNYRFINQFHEFNPVHGMHKINFNGNKENLVVMWTSLDNTTPVGKFKDPLSRKEWSYIKEILSDEGYDVVEVGYRTPIDEVISLCKQCCGGIGYDGSIHQIFKIIQKPVIVFCERTQLNKLLLPWASQFRSFDAFYQSTVMFEDSKTKLVEYQNLYNIWINDFEDYRQDPLYNVPIIS